jgi:hypothetical protein
MTNHALFLIGKHLGRLWWCGAMFAVTAAERVWKREVK